jgi:hypothetical protein
MISDSADLPLCDWFLDDVIVKIVWLNGGHVLVEDGHLLLVVPACWTVTTIQLNYFPSGSEMTGRGELT